MPGQFSITPTGPFSLAQAAGFGFGPREAEDFDGTMRLAFCADDLTHGVGVALTEDDAGVIHGTVQGDAETLDVRTQTARILSLDHDGADWLEVGGRDPVIGRLQQQYAGLRPVLFHSPYEAAAWSVISARRGRRQAMNTRDRISEALGERFTVAGHAMWAFPTPERLLTVTETSDLGPMRVERLRAVAAAATNGALDADRLRAMGADSAIIELQELPGIGPFYAMLIAIRATGFADATPPEEGRVLVAAQRQYGDAMPDYAALVEHSKVWSPFRVWATVLLRVSEERRVH